MKFVAFAIFAVCLYAGPALATQCPETFGSYVNVDGQVVHRPECVTTHQDGETAIWNDGSHSFSKHHNGRLAPWRRGSVGIETLSVIFVDENGEGPRVSSASGDAR